MRLQTVRAALAALVLLAVAPACRASGPGTPPPSTAADGDAAASASIEDRTWRLAGLPGRDVAGEPPSLRLQSAERRAEGDGGCNRFGGSYELSGDSLRMGPLMSTKRACIDEARNAQETALLGALERTRRWRLDGGRLVLLDEQGAEAARFAEAVEAQ